MPTTSPTRYFRRRSLFRAICEAGDGVVVAGSHARFDGRVARALQRMRAQTMGVNRAVRARARVVVAAAGGARDDATRWVLPSLHTPRRRRSRTRTVFGATFSPTRAPTLKPTATPDYGFVPGWASARWAAPRVTPFVRTHVLHTLRYVLSVCDHKHACMHMRAKPPCRDHISWGKTRAATQSTPHLV